MNKFFLFLLILCSFSVSAESPDLIENKMRAAFIYKFTSYFEWPKLQDHFLMTIIEDKEFFNLLSNTTQGKTVNDLPIEVQLLSWEDVEKQNFNSNLVIFPKGNEIKIEQSLVRFKNLPCLTISFGNKLGTLGSMINFYTEDDHLRFEINKNAIDEHKLKISSQLLRLGKMVGQ